MDKVLKGHFLIEVTCFRMGQSWTESRVGRAFQTEGTEGV